MSCRSAPEKSFAPSNKIVNGIIGGWQVAGISSFKDGFPLTIVNATNNSNSFGGNQRPNVLANPNLSNPRHLSVVQYGCFCSTCSLHLRRCAADVSVLESPRNDQYGSHSAKILGTLERIVAAAASRRVLQSVQSNAILCTGNHLWNVHIRGRSRRFACPLHTVRDETVLVTCDFQTMWFR